MPWLLIQNENLPRKENQPHIFGNPRDTADFKKIWSTAGYMCKI